VRRVILSIVAVGVACWATAGEALAAKYDKLSVTGIYGRAYEGLGDIQSFIDYWNRVMREASAADPTFGNASAEEIGVGYSILGEIRYRMGPRFLMALRAEYITDNSSALPNYFGAEFSAAGTPLTVTGVYEFPGVFPGFLKKMNLSLGVGGGVVMRGVYKLEYYFPVNERLTARATCRGFQLHTLAELEYPVLGRWGVTGEISYRYTRMGKLTYRSVSGVTRSTREIWEGGQNTPGLFAGIPFPVAGEKVVYTAAGDEMGLDFSGFNLRIGIRLHVW
jgi:hypothetical protein